MTASLSQGLAIDREYLQRYHRYRRSPTRAAPPLPSECPCARFWLHRGEQTLADFALQYRPDQFSASSSAPEIQVGPNELGVADDGSLELRILTDRILARFRFAPATLRGVNAGGLKRSDTSLSRTIFPRSWSGADHQWITANPLCEVTGEIERTGSTGDSAGRIIFDGRGFHDHQFGTGPIGPGLRWWMRGRVLLNNAAITFHIARPITGSDELIVIESDATGSREIPTAPPRIDIDPANRGVPGQIIAGPLRLYSPRVVGNSPSVRRLVYLASLRGESGSAFCQSRLRKDF